MLARVWCGVWWVWACVSARVRARCVFTVAVLLSRVPLAQAELS